MEDEDTHGKKMARKGRTEVIYKGTFVSKRSLSSFHNDYSGFTNVKTKRKFCVAFSKCMNFVKSIQINTKFAGLMIQSYDYWALDYEGLFLQHYVSNERARAKFVYVF